jgi:hypothetical protein
MATIDQAAKEVIAKTIAHPELVRQRVAELRKELKPVIDKDSINATLAEIDQAIQTFLSLARQATTTSMVASLAQQMNDLENQKRSAEKLLFAVEDDEEEKARSVPDSSRVTTSGTSPRVQVKKSPRLVTCSVNPTYCQLWWKMRTFSRAKKAGSVYHAAGKV